MILTDIYILQLFLQDNDSSLYYISAAGPLVRFGLYIGVLLIIELPLPSTSPYLNSPNFFDSLYYYIPYLILKFFLKSSLNLPPSFGFILYYKLNKSLIIHLSLHNCILDICSPKQLLQKNPIDPSLYPES